PARARAMNVHWDTTTPTERSAKHGDRPDLFLRRISKETDRGLLRIGWQVNPCLFRIRQEECPLWRSWRVHRSKCTGFVSAKAIERVGACCSKGNEKPLGSGKKVSHQNCSEIVIAFCRG